MGRLRRRAAPVALAVALPLAAAAAGAAQGDDEVQTATQLNFSTPGARSLGLGGAFLALADDATAAYANPAGLTQLARPEASLEGRAWNFTSRFADSGHQPETGVTGIGVDTVGGLRFAERRDRSRAVSFLSYAHRGRRWTAAVYRHQLADFAASLDSQGPFVGPRTAVQRVAPARSHLELAIASFGVAGAWRLTERMSLGLGLASYRFRLDSRTDRYARNDPTGDLLQDGLTGNYFGPADFLAGNLANTQTQRGDDSALAANLGLLWRIDARWSVGAVWRQGPRFDFSAAFVDGPRGDRPGEVDPRLGGRGVFHVPDVWGVGVAWRPRETLVLAFDWDRVRYSQMTSEVVNLLLAARGEERAFVVDDADELHLGAEYQAIAWRLPVAFRLGAWWDPDHRMRYTGRNGLLRARFRPGSDELHVAGGLGIVLGRAQLDLAVDRSQAVETLSLSAVARF